MFRRALDQARSPRFEFGGRLEKPVQRPAVHLSDPAPASALAVAAGLAVVLPFVTLGHLSRHMVIHIVAMSVLAPLLATGWALAAPGRAVRARELWGATALQIATLWIWHLPAAHHLAAASVTVTLAMHASLLIAAIWFWLSLIRLREAQQWQGILALLITGKLACLLAALLVFAPRAILATHSHHEVTGLALDDQHLAGLLMIVACPASYVLAGVLIAVRVIGVTQTTQPRTR
jgi:putative membrane protein